MRDISLVKHRSAVRRRNIGGPRPTRRTRRPNRSTTPYSPRILGIGPPLTESRRRGLTLALAGHHYEDTMRRSVIR